MPTPKFTKESRKNVPPRGKGKVPSTVKEGFLNAFIELQSDPKKNILTWAKANPKLFYALATKLIPTEIKGAVNQKVLLEIVRNPNIKADSK